jgi:hypothetical protein
MIPHPTETADDYSCMAPDDGVVLRRFLADERVGHRTYPILVEEFVSAITPWRCELPEELSLALELRSEAVAGMQVGSPVADTNSAERRNSAASALAEVTRLMAQAKSLLEAAGIACCNDLPGTKVHYCEYLRRHSGRLETLKDASLHEYLTQGGYRWKQSGGSRCDSDQTIRRVLLVPAIAALPIRPAAVGGRVRYNGMQLFNSQVKT